MGFLEAIYQGDLTAVRQQLKENSALLNQVVDEQGNTPLHHAVAQHDLALIEFLIYQGAKGTTPNKDGEAAAAWYEEFIASIFNFERLIDSKELQTAIERNEVQVITNFLKGGGTYALRFSRGRTLLHWAVELQRPAVVKVILEETNPKNIPLLLKLKDSQGKTPLILAQDLYQNNNPAAQEILSVLQGKQRTPEPKESVSISQPLPTAWPFLIDQDFKKKINELSNALKNSITVADFAALSPLREVICQLAYITCRQAIPRLSTLKKKEPLEKTLLPRLFGWWCDNTRLEFQRKLQAIVDYLANLIQQQQVNQLIHFSNELSHANGWYCGKEKKIYLNPMVKKANLISLVIALIHEATHKVLFSYDFAKTPYFIDNKGYTMDFNQACQLALIGIDEKLMPKRVKLFELRQLFQKGVSPNCPQRLNHGMALNNADTQTLAILLLATLPEGYAQFDKKQQTLLIKPEFLSEKYFKNHPVPLPLTAPLPVPEQQAVAAQIASVDQPGPSRLVPARRSLKNFFGLIKPKEQKGTNPCSPRSDSSNDSERSTLASRTLSPPVQLQHEMAADTATAGQPVPSFSIESDSDATRSTSSRTPSPPSPPLQQSMAAYSPSANQPGRSRAGSTHRRSLSSISTLLPPGDRHSLASRTSRTSRTTLIAPGYSSDNSD